MEIQSIFNCASFKTKNLHQSQNWSTRGPHRDKNVENLLAISSKITDAAQHLTYWRACVLWRQSSVGSTCVSVFCFCSSPSYQTELSFLYTPEKKLQISTTVLTFHGGSKAPIPRRVFGSAASVMTNCGDYGNWTYFCEHPQPTPFCTCANHG